jgi:phage repressor protein C with HTH and peptisase S24 domain
MASDDEKQRRSRDKLQALAPGWGDRLRKAADELGGVKKAAAVIGIGQGQLSNLVAEGSVPSWPAMAMLARKSGYRQEWLAFAELPERAETPAQPQAPDLPGLIKEDFVWIPEIDARAAAGHSVINTDKVEVLSLFPIPRSLLVAAGVPQERVFMMRAKGTSMEPDIRDGDSMVVAIGETTLRDGEIYVFNVGEDTLVKEVQLEPDGGLTLLSKNPAFAPRKVGRADRTRLSIAGRVLAALKRFG